MSVTIRTRKVLTNRLLNRKQMIIDVLHPNRANVSRKELTELIAKQFKAKDEKAVVVFGLRTAFGGQNQLVLPLSMTRWKIVWIWNLNIV